MPADPYLTRMNRVLRDLGAGVSLELAPSGRRLRMRGTLPTSEGTWTRQRICTGLSYPEGLEQARLLAEQLGRDMRLARAGEPFPFDRWFGKSQNNISQAISGAEAIATTERWWRERRRNPGDGASTWRANYQVPLGPLLRLERVSPDVLRALVRARPPSSRTRLAASIAAAGVAAATGMGDELAKELRQMGRGYGRAQIVPRDLPSDEVIVAVIDGLPDEWQWVAGICATYGTRPHEALLMTDVGADGLAQISGGKTGPRQALPLPKDWIKRWDLRRKRLSARMSLEGSHQALGAKVGQALRHRGAPFRGYDLRHAWAVRAIYHPKISPSLAAKSMGHSLAMHSNTYQRWFDGQSMASLLAEM